MKVRNSNEATISNTLTWLQTTLDETGDIQCVFELEGFTYFNYAGFFSVNEDTDPNGLVLHIASASEEDPLTIYTVIRHLKKASEEDSVYRHLTRHSLVYVTGSPTGGDQSLRYTPLWHPHENVFKVVPTTAHHLQPCIHILDEEEVEDKKAEDVISRLTPEEIAAMKRVLAAS